MVWISRGQYRHTYRPSKEHGFAELCDTFYVGHSVQRSSAIDVTVHNFFVAIPVCFFFSGKTSLVLVSGHFRSCTLSVDNQMYTDNSETRHPQNTN